MDCNTYIFILLFDVFTIPLLAHFLKFLAIDIDWHVAFYFMNEIAMHTDFMVPNQFNKNELLRIPSFFCLFHSTFFSVKKYQYTCTCSYNRFAQNVAGESKHIKTLADTV